MTDDSVLKKRPFSHVLLVLSCAIQGSVGLPYLVAAFSSQLAK